MAGAHPLHWRTAGWLHSPQARHIPACDRLRFEVLLEAMSFPSDFATFHKRKMKMSHIGSGRVSIQAQKYLGDSSHHCRKIYRNPFPQAIPIYLGFCHPPQQTRNFKAVLQTLLLFVGGAPISYTFLMGDGHRTRNFNLNKVA